MNGRGPLRLLARIGIAALFLYGAGLVTLFLLQRHLIYVPDSTSPERPATASHPGLEDVRLTTADGVALAAWFWPAGPQAPAVLFFHGNGGNRRGRLPLMRVLRARGYSVFLLDYRGYGGSDGSPSEAGLYLDADAARAWLVERTRGQLIYFGESLGTGVAVDLATRHPPAALILLSPYDRLTSVAERSFPWIPAGWLLRDTFDSLAKIEDVRSPVLVIHGTRDTLIPAAFGRRLFDRANTPKHWIEVPEAGHNDVLARMGERFYEEIDRFIDEWGTTSK